MVRALSVRVIAELKKRIETCESYKKRINEFLQQQKNRWLDKEITHFDYVEEITKKINGKNPHEWLECYNRYIEDCRKKIKEQERKILKGKILTIFSLFFIISFLFIFAFYLRPTFVGFAVKEQPQIFSETLNFSFTETTEYEWQLENPGLLQSVKISGSIETLDGEVKIYLDNLLILDSSKIKEKTKKSTSSSTSPATGLTIENFESSSQENTTEETPQTTQESPSQQESPLISENLTNITETQIQTQESITENITEIPIQPITPEENITQPPVTETTENLTRTTKEFSDICEETCNLKKLNLNKSSYTLKIQIINAKLFLKEIKYEIIPFPEEVSGNITAPEILINITKNITEILIQEQAEINKPVKWKKHISLEEKTNFSVKIPKQALNIAIKKLPEQQDITLTTSITEAEEKEIEINDTATEFEINYETPAPEAVEEQISETRKRVIVTGLDLNYTNILTFTTISEKVKIGDKSRIKVYWIENNSYIEFNASDIDSNGLIDYIEWITPHLSNQTFEIIIEISKAEHLDENKIFISDIYNETYKLDNIWSEPINANEYVRVTFQENLTSDGDITIFPRIVSGNPKIEVYEKDKNEIIAEFSILKENEYNKVYLTNLQASQDTFDLKVLNGGIEINHIIDPSYSIIFINATEANWASTDFPTVTNCDAGSLDVDDTAYCGNTMSIEAEIGFVNSTHFYEIPSDATITEVTMCTRFFLSNKMDDNAADTLIVYVAENSTGTWAYTQQDSCISTGCTAWKTESTHCYDVTSTINTPLKASNVRISLWISQGDADANQYVAADHNYINISYTQADNIFPLVSIVYPLNNSNFSYVNVNINYTVSDANLQACWYTNTSGRVNNTITCGSNLTTQTWLEGINNITIYANDSANNINSSSVRFIVDTISPSVIISYPTNASNFSFNTVNVNYTVSDNGNGGAGVQACWYSNNSGLVNRSITCGLNITNMTWDGGQNNVTLFANDSVGNLNRTSVTFIVDTTYPLISYGAGTEDDGANVTRNWTYVNITWTEANFKNITFTLRNSTAEINSTTFTTTTYIINWTNLAYTNYTYNVSIYDSVGNFNSTETRKINLSAPSANQPPQITSVSEIAATNPVELNVRNIVFNFTVYDENGASDINLSSANANFTKAGEAVRENLSCLNTNSAGNYANFSCTIAMWYWDAPGIWNITAYAKDNAEASAQNTTTNFTYNQLQAIVISPAQISFNVSIGAENQTATNDPTIINNTGNANITSGNVQINAINLYGGISTSEFIDVTNFSVSIDTGGTPPIECNTTAATLSNGTDIAITNAILPRGNLSQGGGIAQEQIYYCFKKVPSTISSQTYSTTTAGSWTIKILIAVFIFAPQLSKNKRKRKQKERVKITEEDKLIQAINLIADELKQEYSLNKKEVIEIIIEKLREKYKVSKKEISEILAKESSIPITIFSKKLGALEALTKYMKENLNLSYREISNLLKRNERTIWTSYNKAIKKQKQAFEIKETETFLPISIFNKHLTMLESIIVYLKQKGFKYVEIAKLLERDQRNIWTIYSRAVKKIKRKI